MMSKAKIRALAATELKPGESVFEAVVTYRWVSTGNFTEESTALREHTNSFKPKERLDGYLKFSVVAGARG